MGAPTAGGAEPPEAASNHGKELFGQTWSGATSDAKSPPKTWTGMDLLGSKPWTDLLGQARIRGNPLTLARFMPQPASQSTKPTTPGRRCGLTSGSSIAV